MGFIIGLLTLIMVLDCLLLVLLVLIQLPKKEAGAGLAFGGGYSDALFGAGSGNVMTKITKYAAGIFFGLALFLGILQSRFSGNRASRFEKDLSGPGRVPAAAAPSTLPAAAPGSPQATPTAPVVTTNLMLPPTAENTNLPVAPATPVAAPTTNTPPPK